MSSQDFDTPQRSTTLQQAGSIHLQELTRRNPSALAMDALYLITVSFFVVLATKAWTTFAIRLPATSIIVGPIPFSWPFLIAAIPLGVLLYFGLRSSKAFFASQVAVIALTLLAVAGGLVPF